MMRPSMIMCLLLAGCASGPNIPGVTAGCRAALPSPATVAPVGGVEIIVMFADGVFATLGADGRSIEFVDCAPAGPLAALFERYKPVSVTGPSAAEKQVLGPLKSMFNIRFPAGTSVGTVTADLEAIRGIYEASPNRIEN
jgi:hypothetical protein